MAQPGYQSGSEPLWWWKIAMHLDEAQLALANAMAHNTGDPRSVHVLQDRLREGQAILLEIFRAKGLLPTQANGAPAAAPPSAGPSSLETMSVPAVPDDFLADVARSSGVGGVPSIPMGPSWMPSAPQGQPSAPPPPPWIFPQAQAILLVQPVPQASQPEGSPSLVEHAEAEAASATAAVVEDSAPEASTIVSEATPPAAPEAEA